MMVNGPNINTYLMARKICFRAGLYTSIEAGQYFGDCNEIDSNLGLCSFTDQAMVIR